MFLMAFSVGVLERLPGLQDQWTFLYKSALVSLVGDGRGNSSGALVFTATLPARGCESRFFGGHHGS